MPTVFRIIISWLILTFALWVAAIVVPGVRIKSFRAALPIGAVFGVLNATFGWLLFVVLGFASLGLGFVFGFVTRIIATAIILKVTDAFFDGFDMKGLWPPLAMALIVSAIAYAVESVLWGIQ